MKKNNLHILNLLLAFLIFSNHLCYCQEDSQVLTYEASYVSDFVGNISGGIDQSSTYLGMIDLAATFSTENAGLWRNGEFYIQIGNTHGGTPSADLVGDFQMLSNIENSDFTYLCQLWFKQSFNRLSFTIGVHDMNSEFLISEYAGEYVNGSFGIMPSVSMNVPLSISPKNALGAVLQYNPVSYLSFLLGLYDGDPLDLEQDKYNMNFSLSSEEGYFSIFEMQYNIGNNEESKATYKVGGYYHSGDFINVTDSIENINGNYGFYLIADQSILSWVEYSRSLNAFAKFGISPQNRCFNNLFLAIGFNYYSPFKKRINDVMGLAIAKAFVSKNLINMSNGMCKSFETVLELMYKAKINQNIFIQPEIQYIINPGANTNLSNAIVGLLRTSISF